MITQRRIFQAHPGSGGAVVEKMKEFQAIFEQHGGPHTRIYTDQLSGPTDRIVWEFDVETLADLEQLFWAASQQDDYVRAYEAWYEGLKPLIQGATVELWKREV